MENNPSPEESKIMTYEDIIKEGEDIYPLSGEVEKKSFDINNIKNWSEIFYAFKGEKTMNKFNIIFPKYKYKL